MISMLILELLSSCLRESIFFLRDLIFVESTFKFLFRISRFSLPRLSTESHIKSVGYIFLYSVSRIS